jgi:hypothetical protein
MKLVYILVVAAIFAGCSGSKSDSDNATKSAAAASAAPATASPTDTPAPTPEPTATPEPTDTPTPKPDFHAMRQPYQEYWNKVIGKLAMSYVCISFAAKSVADSDLVEASKILEKGQQFADDAKNDTSGGVPERWNNDDIGLKLFAASNKLSDGISKARAFLDDGKPSEMAEAQNDAAEARAYVDDATHAARVNYMDMGGRAADLESLPDQANGLLSVFTSLMGN